MGYATGLSVGALFGLVRPRFPSLPIPVAAVGIGAAAMATSDVPMALLGVSDPRTWPASSWMADIVPHLASGLATALAYEGFSRDR